MATSAKQPVKKFWAVTAYAPSSRSLLSSRGARIVSSLKEPQVNGYGPLEGRIKKTWVLNDLELLD